MLKLTILEVRQDHARSLRIGIYQAGHLGKSERAPLSLSGREIEATVVVLNFSALQNLSTKIEGGRSESRTTNPDLNYFL
jgi:hypothetical protein